MLNLRSQTVLKRSGANCERGIRQCITTSAYRENFKNLRDMFSRFLGATPELDVIILVCETFLHEDNVSYTWVYSVAQSGEIDSDQRYLCT